MVADTRRFFCAARAFSILIGSLLAVPEPDRQFAERRPRMNRREFLSATAGTTGYSLFVRVDSLAGLQEKRSADEILTLLDRLNKEFKKTIVMVTHDPRAAEKAHVVRHLDKGEFSQN